MKRLFVSAALAPLLFAVQAQAETKISTATTAPVRTSTVAGGQPDSITIEAAGSIAPTVSGAAVTVDSSHAVINNGAISFTGVSNATGILVNAGVATAITNAGAISLVEDFTPTDADSDGDLDGPFAQGSGRFGIRATGAQPVTSNIITGGPITVEGNDSAGISLETRLIGNLTQAGGGVTVVGDRSVGVRADSVSGDVKLLGAIGVQGEGSVAVQLGPVDGAVVLQGSVSATGYRTTERQVDAVRAKFDADDLKQGGGAVRITGSVGKGVLLDRPPNDNSTTDTDEDDDGITDSAEGSASVGSFGSAPAIDIGGTSAITLGAVGVQGDAYGFVNRGAVTANGVNDGVSATGLRIGQAGGGTVTVAGGIHNQIGATLATRAFGAQSTAVLLNGNAVVPAFVNAGSIGAEQTGGLHDARGIVDLSGALLRVENSGAIRAVVNPATGVAQTGRAVAIDLSAATQAATVRQFKVNASDTPSIAGDILFGSGADRLELSAGTYAGTLSFGAGADALVVDGGATATVALVDSDGQLSLDLRNGRLAVANTSTVNLTSLNIGATGVLAVNIDPTATAARFNAATATLASGAKVEVTLTGLSRGTRSFQIVQAGALAVGDAGVTLAGAPFLFQANLRPDTAAGALFVDLRPKTATELGLNRSGAQAYPALFESLDTDEAVEQAFLSQTTQAGFNALYDQMLPDHSGGVLMSAAAVSAGVSSAVAAPMPIDKESATGVWAQEIVFNIKRDRDDALGFKSQGFGFAAGMDLQGEANAVGANVSFVTTDVKDRGAAAGEQVSMNLFGAGLYWRLDGGPLQAAVRGGVGYAAFDGERRLTTATLNLRADAKWNAWMADAYAGVSYEWRMGGFYARPELSASYIRLAEDGYREKGGGAGFNLIVDKRTGDLLQGEALLAVGWRMGDEVYFAPEIKGGYRAKLAGGLPKTTAHFEGGQDFTLDPEDVFKGGYVVRAGVRGGASRALYSVNAGATMDGDYEEYDVRAGVRFQF